MSDKAAAETGAAVSSALQWPPDSGKFRLLAGILLTLSGLYGATYLSVSIARGWPDGFGDSFALWLWGRFAIEHPAVSIYDAATLRNAQLALGMDPGASYPFGYPPSYLLVLWPLAQLPGWLSFVALTLIGVPLYLWATLGADWRLPRVLTLLAMPTTAIAIVSGQSALLAVALLIGGVRLAEGRPVAAGVLFGLLSYKPQFGLLVPVALMAMRAWRAVAAAAVTVLLLVAVTSILFGPDMWRRWIEAVPLFSRQFGGESTQIRHLMPTVLASLTEIGAAPAIAQAAQGVVTAAAIIATWWLFRRRPDGSAAAGLLVAVPLATPYGFIYDMPLLATAILWRVADRRRNGGAFDTFEMLVMILALIAPMLLAAGPSRFPLAPLAMLALLACIVRDRWRGV